MITPLDKRPHSGPYSGLSARSAKRFVTQAFQNAEIPFAENEALDIILSATGMDRADLMLNGHEVLKPEIFAIITDHMQRRLKREPLDHILGWRDFYGRRFAISKDVLSPRADTEILVGLALDALKQIEAPRILDLGTGSGAIGLTILADREDAKLVATDISEKALNIARQNADALGVETRVDFRVGKWWTPIKTQEKFDAVLSNPPYIDAEAMEQLEPEVVHFDPALALAGGEDGLRDYRLIMEDVIDHLRPNGWIGLEIGFDQANAVSTIFSEAGFQHPAVSYDLGGNARCVSARNTN